MTTGSPLALTALLLSLLANFAAAQFISYNGASQLVFGARGLQVAINDPDVSGIIISGNVTLNSTTWTSTPVIANRSLLLSGDANNQNDNVLNFGGLLGAIVIGEGGEVEFRNLTLSNPGPQNIGNSTSNNVNYRSISVGAWPSLVVLDGSTVFFNNSRLFYYSQIEWSRCANFAAKIRFDLINNQNEPNVSIVPGNNASLLVPNLLNLTSDISDINTNQTVGQVDLITENTTMTCVDDPFPQDRRTSGAPIVVTKSSGFKWWYGLIIALAVVLGIAVIAGIVCCLLVRRRLRRSASHDSERGAKVAGVDTVAVNGSAGHDRKSPVMVDAAAQSCGELTGSSGTQKSPPQATLDGLRSIGPSESAVSTSGQELDALPSGGLASSLGKGSGAHSESGAFSWSDVTALLRARSDFSDIEVGPLIGRGSFGRVYKGRWKGAFIAIKIVDHQEAASKVIAMREGALSHSVQHPNVITTYSVFLQQLHPQHRRDKEDWAEDRSPPEDAMEGIPERAGPSFTEEQEHFATCMVLDYADRGTLEKAVMNGKFISKSTGQPDMKAIHRTLLDIAGGMDYLHSVGVLHGDLKGANVLLKSTATDPRGFSCKLADFGMARVLDTNRTHVSTQTYGTISYMPAELLRDGKLTRAVDSYSFAILIWELFSGQMLHTGLTIAQVFYKVCYEQFKPTIPEGMPEEYSTLMIRCWDEDPAKRPTFSEIFGYLQTLPTGRTVPRSSLSSTLGSPSRKPSDSPSFATDSVTASIEDPTALNAATEANPPSQSNHAAAADDRATQPIEKAVAVGVGDTTTQHFEKADTVAESTTSAASSSPQEASKVQGGALPNPFAAAAVKSASPIAPAKASQEEQAFKST